MELGAFSVSLAVKDIEASRHDVRHHAACSVTAESRAGGLAIRSRRAYLESSCRFP